MIEKINAIKRVSFAELIKNGELTLFLLEIYSKLYVGGSEISTCEKSLKKYYEQIKINVMEKIEKYKEVEKRTCVPNWSGNIFISATCRHWHSDLITDSDAIYLLKNKYLDEDYFKEIPETLKSKSNETSTKPNRNQSNNKK